RRVRDHCFEPRERDGCPQASKHRAPCYALTLGHELPPSGHYAPSRNRLNADEPRKSRSLRPRFTRPAIAERVAPRHLDHDTRKLVAVVLHRLRDAIDGRDIVVIELTAQSIG